MNPSRIYSPTIQKGSTLYTLPLPLEALEEAYALRIGAEDIPLVTGVLITSVVAGALSLSFNGIIVKDNPGAVLREKTALESLFLDAPDTPFHFYRYYDNTNNYFRWYPNCVCSGLRFNFSPITVYHLPYSVSFICPGGRELVNGTYPGDSSAGDDALPEGASRFYAPLIIDLNDDDGASAVIIRNASKQPVARIKSNGDIEVIGRVIETESIS